MSLPGKITKRNGVPDPTGPLGVLYLLQTLEQRFRRPHRHTLPYLTSPTLYTPFDDFEIVPAGRYHRIAVSPVAIVIMDPVWSRCDPGRENKVDHLAQIPGVRPGPFPSRQKQGVDDFHCWSVISLVYRFSQYNNGNLLSGYMGWLTASP